MKASNTPFTSKVRQQLLVLDEPTSGIDPVVRREFIETVIGAYQSGVPKRRTAFFSTHLISEFEGLIHEFTVIEARRNVCTVEADAARDRFQMIPARNSSATFTTPRPGEGRGEGPPETTLLHHTRISGNTQRR